MTKKSNERKNIYSRILEVMGRVSYLKKDTDVKGKDRVTTQYKALSHDKVVREVRTYLIENGIATAQTLKSHEIISSGSTSIFSGEYIISFINVDDPKDRLEVSCIAHSYMFDDKAPGKAASYAFKNAILKTFMIETGENDEQSQEASSNKAQNAPKSPPKVIKVNKIPIAAASFLKDLSDNLGESTKFLNLMKVDKFCDIDVSKYNNALHLLRGKYVQCGEIGLFNEIATKHKQTSSLIREEVVA